MELISKKGYEKLCREYAIIDEKITNTQRAMGESAKRDNDLRENLEFMELRVKVMYTLPAEKEKLYKRMHNSMIIEDSDFFKEFDGTKVIPGSKVTYQIDDETETFTILGDNESDLKNQVISCSTPLAKALIGKHIDDKIDFNGMRIIIKSIEKI
jgi:transcription elongation GreA/GreB family factor